VHIEYHSQELSHCPECFGFWFKDGQFREVKNIGFAGLPGAKERAEAPEEAGEQSESANEVEKACPECEESVLMPYSYAYSSGIQLHRCTKCHGIWADMEALLQIENLLSHYQESLEEAKSKALPLMMKVKNQIQQEELEQEEQQKKKGVFKRFFGSKATKSSKSKKVQDIFDNDEDDSGQF
jgi:Zn-finger nucleic acid-binding protein